MRIWMGDGARVKPFNPTRAGPKHPTDRLTQRQTAQTLTHKDSSTQHSTAQPASQRAEDKDVTYRRAALRAHRQLSSAPYLGETRRGRARGGRRLRWRGRSDPLLPRPEEPRAEGLLDEIVAVVDSIEGCESGLTSLKPRAGWRGAAAAGSVEEAEGTCARILEEVVIPSQNCSAESRL